MCFTFVVDLAAFRNEYPDNYKQEGFAPFVVDAVYAMAHAIQNLLKDRCFHNSKTNHEHHQEHVWDRNNSCIKEPIKGHELLSYIRKVSFRSKY
ncbi:metabotropic glutamate receptor 8-like protein [Leptotrombidium deliense]|uniref:Metabotropic glutamate receptor 8-like protein n=1 Tax=Leptotrombidium deliense TaxID=299467 RepID=A0A443SDB7_9ACAR|nr:metabotropic glutamate receptor 8-like protein [Leptotrombidium deliense]